MFVCYLLKLVDVRDDGFMLKPMVMVVGSPYKALIDWCYLLTDETHMFM